MSYPNVEQKMSRTISLDEISAQRKSPAVWVKEHQIPECDEDAWAAATAKRLGEIAEQRKLGGFYLNPLFTVSASIFSKEFNHKARQCQAAWYIRVDQVLLRKHRKRRERELNFWKRQAAYTGVLIINGRPIPPHEWTAIEKGYQIKF